MALGGGSMFGGGTVPPETGGAQAPALETKQLQGFSGGAVPLYGKQAQQSRNIPPASGPANAFDFPDVLNSIAEYAFKTQDNPTLENALSIFNMKR